MSIERFKKSPKNINLPKKEQPKLLPKATRLALLALTTALINLPHKVQAQNITPDMQPSQNVVQTEGGSELIEPTSVYIGPESQVPDGAVKTEDGSLLEYIPSDLPNLENQPKDEAFSFFTKLVIDHFKDNIPNFSENDIAFHEFAGGKVRIEITYYGDSENNKKVVELLEKITGKSINSAHDELSIVVDPNTLSFDK